MNNMFHWKMRGNLSHLPMLNSQNKCRKIQLDVAVREDNVPIVQDVRDATSYRYPVRSIARAFLYQPCPLKLFRQVTKERPHTLLLESANIESKDHLKSMLMTHAALKLECRNRQVECAALTDNGRNLLPLLLREFSSHVIQKDEDRILILIEGGRKEEWDEEERLRMESVLDVLRFFTQRFSLLPGDEIPLLVAGVFAYDLIATFEPLPDVPEGFNDCPDYLFYVAETFIVLDHQRRDARIVSHVFPGEDESHHVSRLTRRNHSIQVECESDSTASEGLVPILSAPTDSKSDAEYCDDVRRIRVHIEAGDVFQAVPSRSFFLPCQNTLNAYHALKETNPSPYIFYLRADRFVLFGASPESALKYDSNSNKVEIYPIAGTRRRGRDEHGNFNLDLDSRIEFELRQDSKEVAEHMMLVDLARNDIARICEPGSRSVPELLKVDRYSHVMHLVSRVTGHLREGLDALHAYQACMNMGTLVGAPKVRAAQLIREVERQRRGSYGGAVGYLNSNGDMDTCIVIRSAFVKDGVACIQAGAGVVFDSDPQAEADETRGKAQAVIGAIQMGGGL